MQLEGWESLPANSVRIVSQINWGQKHKEIFPKYPFFEPHHVPKGD